LEGSSDPPSNTATFIRCHLCDHPQEFDAFLSALSPVLGRLSYAFSRILLVCEGTIGFQAQVGGAGVSREG